MRILLILLCFMALIGCKNGSATNSVDTGTDATSDTRSSLEDTSQHRDSATDMTLDTRPDLNITTCVPMTTEEGLGPKQISESLFVVHSGLRNTSNGMIENTSNIFLFGPDANGGFWIFGSGYGTFDTEAETYRRGNVEAARTTAEDVLDVHGLLMGCMGATPGEANINFLIPHAHLDHVNAEFFTELVALGYPLDKITIFVHENDNRATTCNAPCCRVTPCNVNAANYGVPFDPPWTPEQTGRFRVIGAQTDICGDKILDIDIGDFGVWEVFFSPGHTPGAINLVNQQQQILITGSNAQDFDCRAPTDLTWWHVHGTQPR